MDVSNGGRFSIASSTALGTTDRFVIDGNGNVGIGTTNPASKLHVASSTSGGNIQIGGPTTYGYINFDAGTGFWDFDSKIGAGTPANYNYFNFKTDGSSAMVIRGGGNVGIGTTNPGAKLEVYGNPGGNYIAYFENTNVYGLGIKTTGTTASHQQIYVTKGDNTLNFATYADGSGYLRAAAWTYTSDARVKENISYLSGGLEKVLQLNPAKFDYINGSKENLGFIAQDVQVVIPEAVVVTDQSTGMLGLKTEFIIPYIVEAIQEIASITGTFKTNLIAWLGDTANGIASLFAKELNTETLCVADTSGSKTCINKAQLDALIAGVASSGSLSSSTPAPEPAPQPSPEATVGEAEPASEPVPEPTPAPAPEPAPALEPIPTTPPEGSAVQAEPAPEPAPAPAPEPAPTTTP